MAAVAEAIVEAPGMSTPSAARAFHAVTWVNGKRQDADAPHISARDRGFTLADGLFETMRVARGCVFRLERHLTRLREGLAVLGIDAPAGLRDRVLEAVDGAAADEASLRLTVSRGVGPGGLAPPDVPPTVVVTVGPRPSVPARIYEAGLSAHVVEGRRNERSMTNGLKTLSYTDAVVALMDAVRHGADEAILLDTEGHCSEASASNLFVWTGRVLMTPPVSCGALPGITRSTVMEIASARGVEVQEQPFDLNQLRAGQEAFLTSSLRGIAPLVTIDGHAVGAGTPGELTRSIAAAYASIVDDECSRGQGA
jgi:branched-chain amino acid aminotransferase